MTEYEEKLIEAIESTNDKLNSMDNTLVSIFLVLVVAAFILFMIAFK